MVTRIVLIGGFLGAGKTTLINKAAKQMVGSGKKVALIANDQGEALVDTQFSRGNGYQTAEVLRGCFCCRFPDLMQGARGLISEFRPDIIIAEPVGSCTDLQATVVAPLRSLYKDEFAVAPLMVLVDSSRLSSDEIEAKSIGGYLRKHQIEEAEYVVLSKADMIPKARLEELIAEVKKLNPAAKVIGYSAITGQGFDEILGIINSSQISNGSPVDVDYDTYADAEAELGWYNGYLTFSVAKMDAYDLGTKVLRYIAERYDPQDIAHAKVLLRSGTSTVKLSLILSNLTVDGVKGSRYAEGEVELFVNGRVVSSPEALRTNIQSAVKRALSEAGVQDYRFTDDCFSPGRPNPTYRMKAGV
ncbi:GTP-binding protein [Methanomassiliicoccus luminyensis]|uniref:GTP-binding protein n=1 Tax=Methanomassiliicoccus luminyensis TaxID=1080712 RepID=UPI0003759EC6|nr:GTP-binding protein [Methanomassiliicoccus luminyensis]